MKILSISLAGAMCFSTTLCAQSLDALQPDQDVHTQGQLIHLLEVMNQYEIDEAELALNHTEHDGLKAYAQQLIGDHESSNNRIEELIRSGIEPESSELAEQLAMQSGERMEEMSARDDANLLCAFLGNQISQHELGVQILSHELQPQVEDENVQEFLDLSLADFERHLTAAQELFDSSVCAEEQTIR